MIKQREYTLTALPNCPTKWDHLNYPWSSARVHCGIETSAVLPVGTPPGLEVSDWSACLAEAEQPTWMEALRKYTWSRTALRHTWVRSGAGAADGAFSRTSPGGTATPEDCLKPPRDWRRSPRQ